MSQEQEFVWRTCGLSIDQIKVQLADLFPEGTDRELFFLDSHDYGIDIRPKGSEALDLIKPLREEIIARLGDNLYAEGIQDLEEVVGQLLRHHYHTLAVAESCTGGLIADRLTDIPGSSEYFRIGLVVYSNQAKHDLLGVRKETLGEFGAVSPQTVQEMGTGLRKISHSDLALAVSGIAGPGGGSVQKPVGLVYIGLYDGQNHQIKEFRFKGGRRSIKVQSSQMALDLVRRYYL